MMVGTNLTDIQLQQIVDKTILEGDHDKDGMINYEEFKQVSLVPRVHFLIGIRTTSHGDR